MVENPHYKELLQLLNEFQVEYLIVGWSKHQKNSTQGTQSYTEEFISCVLSVSS